MKNNLLNNTNTGTSKIKNVSFINMLKTEKKKEEENFDLNVPLYLVYMFSLIEEWYSRTVQVVLAAHISNINHVLFLALQPPYEVLGLCVTS
jgi:hypothetical protein